MSVIKIWKKLYQPDSLCQCLRLDAGETWPCPFKEFQKLQASWLDYQYVKYLRLNVS